MASTIHDERPSTSTYVPEQSSSTTASTRPASTTSTSMATSTATPFWQPNFSYGYHQQPPSYHPQVPGHWANNGYTRAFTPGPMNWTPPRPFLPQVPPFYMQQNPGYPPNFGYSYSQPIPPPPPGNIMTQAWTPPPPYKPHPTGERDHRNHSLQPQGQGPNEPGDCWNNAVVAWEQRTMIHNKIGLIINERYRIIQNIDSGSYGTIFVAEDLKQNNERVAVKFDAASKDDHLKYEYEVYKSALYDDGCYKIEGFPRVHWFGNQFGHNVLVLELLGPPLSLLFNFCERKFGFQTIMSLGEQMIRRIKHLHMRGFIHRDVKLENFLMGLGDQETICYLIDFGLARRYRYREGRLLKHIPFRKGRNFVGTAKYASVNSHKNAELSRRDDVESLGYVLIELINGSLPWKKLKVRNAYSTKHQMYIKIRNMKEQASWSEICPAMAEWMTYCKSIPFAEEPDYDLLLRLLKKIPEICKNNAPDLSETLQDLNLDDPRCSQCRHRDPKAPSKMFKEEDEDTVDESYSDNENPIICNEKSRERKLSKSASVNTLNPQHSLPPLTTSKPYAESVSDSKTAPLPSHHFEDDTASVASTCRKCRQRRQQYLDERCAATGTKYSWQIWREMTPELKFQYENRFSWTLNDFKIRDPRLLQPSLVHQNHPPQRPLHSNENYAAKHGNTIFPLTYGPPQINAKHTVMR